MRRIPLMASMMVLVGTLLISSASSALCQESGKEQAALATALRGKHVSLATATLKDGQPVAEITLNKGKEFKTVTEPLS